MTLPDNLEQWTSAKQNEPVGSIYHESPTT